MSSGNNKQFEDHRQRFIFPRIGIWGVCVRLGSTWREILSHHDYDDVVAVRLGQALAATSLLSCHIKSNGSLILQTQSDGPLHTLVAQSTQEGTVRGLAKSTGIVMDGDLATVFGAGKLVMTIDNEQEERYQGIVALEGEQLSRALQTYFSQSEQLSTRLWLQADKEFAAGMLLQRLPVDNETETLDDGDPGEDWSRVTILADTLRTRELIESSPAEIMHRLFHQEKIRKFVPEDIRFHCGCSASRIEAVLLTLGKNEVFSIIDERGAVDVDCEFCNRHYRFEETDCTVLFEEGNADARKEEKVNEAKIEYPDTGDSGTLH